MEKRKATPISSDEPTSKCRRMHSSVEKMRNKAPWGVLVPLNAITRERVGALYLASAYSMFGKNETQEGVSTLLFN